eukprot:1189205-Rhodomonas_salina.2
MHCLGVSASDAFPRCACWTSPHLRSVASHSLTRALPLAGLLCGRYACAVGGLWGKACGCSHAAEEAARAEEERLADVQYQKEE